MSSTTHSCRVSLSRPVADAIEACNMEMIYSMMIPRKLSNGIGVNTLGSASFHSCGMQFKFGSSVRIVPYRRTYKLLPNSQSSSLKVILIRSSRHFDAFPRSRTLGKTSRGETPAGCCTTWRLLRTSRERGKYSNSAAVSMTSGARIIVRNTIKMLNLLRYCQCPTALSGTL